MKKVLQKTFVERDSEELDKAVNEFIKNNVRIVAGQSYSHNDGHARVIFYEVDV